MRSDKGFVKQGSLSRVSTGTACKGWRLKSQSLVSSEKGYDGHGLHCRASMWLPVSAWPQSR